MSTIVTRAGKGSALTHNEVDANFTNLNNDKIEAAQTVTLTNKTLSTGTAITAGTINNATIGASTPSSGAFTTLSATGVTTVQAGTAAAPAITTSGDTNTGIFFPAADTIAFTKGGVESMRIDSSGNLVINNSTGGYFGLGNTITAYPSLTFPAVYGTASVGTGIFAEAGNLVLQPRSSGALRSIIFATGNPASERMRIDSSGNVGIGTTSSALRLEVGGSFGGIAVSNITTTAGTTNIQQSYSDGIAELRIGSNTSSNTTAAILVKSGNAGNTIFNGNVGIGTSSPNIQTWRSGTYLTVANASTRGQIEIDGAVADSSSASLGALIFTYSTNTTNHKDVALIEAISSGATANQRGGVLNFYTKANGTAAPSLNMTLDASGQLGIGITSPTGLLDVYKAAQGGSNTFRAYGPAGQILWANGGASTSYLDSDTIIFRASANSSNTERARITSGGALLVGTTAGYYSGTSLFEVYADVSSVASAITNINTTATNGCLGLWQRATSGNNLFINFNTDTAGPLRGSIDYNRAAGQVRYNQTSDATLKNIIGDSDGQKSVEILNSTRIREYAWKDDEQQKPQIGVIAQELYETYKGAVSVGGDIEKTDAEGNVTTEYRPWGVDKTAFTFHLIAGWQAHEKMIQELKAEIAALKGNA